MNSGASRRVASALALAVAATACSALPGLGPDPLEGADDFAAAVADALAEADLSAVALTADSTPDDGPTVALETIVAGMGEERRPEVTVESVTPTPESRSSDGRADDGTTRATATLAWTWPVAETTWDYTTEADLVRETGEDDADWELAWEPSVVEPSLVAGETLDVTTLRPRRGDILGAGDEPLVTLRDVVRFGVDKSKVDADQAVVVAREVARRVDVDVAAYVERVRAAGERAFVEAIVLRAPDAEPILDDGSYDAIDGAAALGTRIPLPPSRGFAAPILGSFGPATAEMIEDSDGALSIGDNVGLSGLQARYEERLAGTPGTEVRALAPDGTARELYVEEVQDALPLRITLDYDAQTLAESLLADIGPASALVAIEPSTGHLLAVASGPGSAGYSTATLGQYAPGSTFKTVTALALLRGGLRPAATVACPATENVDGRRFSNYDDYPAAQQGRITLRRAFAHSCNTAMIGERERVSPDDLAEAAAALGLGVDHDTGFPSYFGQVPPPESDTGAAAALIGQGTVLASPMAMAVVAASVVRGEAVLPVLVTDHETAPPSPAQPLRPAEAEALRALMRAVVTEGSGRSLADLPGPPVLAKTGTAEFGSGAETHAWMIAAQGDLAVAAFVETGESGSRTAGPLIEGFLRGVR